MIPIVFSVADDPVKLGLVSSLANPNGNATGISFLTVELDRKRLEVIREVVPKAAAMAMLLNPQKSAECSSSAGFKICGTRTWVPAHCPEREQ